MLERTLFVIFAVLVFNSCNKNEVLASKETGCAERELTLAKNWESLNSELYYGSKVNVTAKIAPYDFYTAGYTYTWIKPNGERITSSNMSIDMFTPSDEGEYKVFGRSKYCTTKEYAFTITGGKTLTPKCAPQDNWYTINGLSNFENKTFSPYFNRTKSSFSTSYSSSPNEIFIYFLDEYDLRVGKFKVVANHPENNNEVSVKVRVGGQNRYASIEEGEVIITRNNINKLEITICDIPIRKILGTEEFRLTYKAVY